MKALDYKIIRSPKRTKLSITVERDRAVVVRTPEKPTDDDVRQVIDDKRQWILEKLRSPQKYEDRLHPPGKEVSGESAPFLGRDYRIEIADTESGARSSAATSSQFLRRIKPSAARFCVNGTSTRRKRRFCLAPRNMRGNWASNSAARGSSTTAAISVADLNDPTVAAVTTPVVSWDRATLFLGVARPGIDTGNIVVATREKLTGKK